MSNLVLIDHPADGVRRITLNRPDRLNALNRELASELTVAVRAAGEDESVRVVILRGNGRAFCAGADLDEHFVADNPMDIGRTDLWDRLESLRVPVIAAVHGWAITGGFLLAYCCDIVVASEDACFRDTHAALGLLPTGGESQRMPRRLGGFLARELMLTSRPFTAQEALAAGFVRRVVPRRDLDATALDLGVQVAGNAPHSVSAIKALVNRGLEGDFGTGLRLEALTNRFGTANNEPNEERAARVRATRSGRSS
jgi:enoyl-CoA hydratase/carnithine racemase